MTWRNLEDRCNARFLIQISRGDISLRLGFGPDRVELPRVRARWARPGGTFWVRLVKISRCVVGVAAKRDGDEQGVRQTQSSTALMSPCHHNPKIDVTKQRHPFSRGGGRYPYPPPQLIVRRMIKIIGDPYHQKFTINLILMILIRIISRMHFLESTISQSDETVPHA